MERGNIPGYYYDRDKQKYFKIVPNHVATPASDRYSKDSVARAEKNVKIASAQKNRAAAIRSQLVKAACILKAPLAAGISLNRELSTRISLAASLDVRAKAYAAGLRQGVTTRAKTGISAFAHDPATGGFLLGSKDFSGQYTINALSNEQRGNESLDPLAAQDEILEAFPSEVSSISISPSRIASITCLGGEHGTAKVAFMSLKDPELTPRRSIDWQTSSVFNLPDETTAWTCAANPFRSNQSYFVIGLSLRTILFNDADGSIENTQTLTSSSDVFALDWLTPNVASVGHRNGSVKLWDIRSEGSSMRLQHPSCITGIRSVNAETVVICGLENMLAMYDLRMPLVNNVEPPTKRRKGRARRSSILAHTTPIYYFDYQNESNRALGFDLDAEHGLVAAATDNGDLVLYSISTGDKVSKHLDMPRIGHADSSSNTSNSTDLLAEVHFCRDSMRSGRSFLAALGSRDKPGRLHQWFW